MASPSGFRAVPTSHFGSTTQSNQQRRQPCHIAHSRKHSQTMSAENSNSCRRSPTSRLPMCSSQRISFRRKTCAFRTTCLACHPKPSSTVVSNVMETYYRSTTANVIASICYGVAFICVGFIVGFAFTLVAVNDFMHCNQLENIFDPALNQWVQRQGDCWLIPSKPISQ